jgi:hypothetical protein
MRRRLDELLGRRPWIGGLLFAGGSVAMTVGLVRRELDLYPRGAAQIGCFAVGLVAAPLLGFAATRFGAGRLWLQIAGGVLFGLALLSGPVQGLGWARHGSIDPAQLPRAEQTFGAGAAVSTILFTGGIAFLVLCRPGLSAGRWLRMHAVEVHDVRPDPADPKGCFEPYFVALCECGWAGEPRDTSEEAFADARSHTPNVDRTIRRPVG